MHWGTVGGVAPYEENFIHYRDAYLDWAEVYLGSELAEGIGLVPLSPCNIPSHLGVSGHIIQTSSEHRQMGELWGVGPANCGHRDHM